MDSDFFRHSWCVIKGLAIRRQRILEIKYANPAPTNWAAMKPGAPVQRIPENVSVKLLAIVTAGFANDVEDVHQ